MFPLKTIKHPTIIKSNNLIDAVYKMPINAKHLFSIMLRYITVKTPIRDKDNNINIFAKHRQAIQDNGQLHTITAEDYGKLLGIADKSTQYRELKKATDQLLSTIIKVPLENGDYVKYHIFDSAKYAVGDGYTSLAFARNFLPLIQNLQGNYTKLRLAETLRLKKFASVRLYEKMMQYRGDDCSGWYEASLDDLKLLLGVKKGHIYWENYQFNAKVFNPAIKEIIKQLHWKIKVQKIKIGRRIVAVRIEYSDPNYGGLFSQETKQVLLNQAKAKSKVLAKVSALAHHKKIGIK
jgi:plasmid replication initiation protein